MHFPRRIERFRSYFFSFSVHFPHRLSYNFTEGQKKATVEVWNEKERKTTESISEIRKAIKELSGKLVCHLNAADGKHSANSSGDTSRTVSYPYGADSAQKAFEIYDLQLINRTKEFDRLEAQYIQRRAAYDRLLQRQTELEIYEKVASEGRPSEENARPVKSGKGQQPSIEEDDNRKLVCRLENEIIRNNEQWLQAETIGRKYEDIRGTLMNDATKFEQSLVEVENALEQQNVDIDNVEVRFLRTFFLKSTFLNRFG